MPQKEMPQKHGSSLTEVMFTEDSDRLCSVCETIAFQSRDTYYLELYQCCAECFGKWIEGREERWRSGWRPKHTSKRPW